MNLWAWFKRQALEWGIGAPPGPRRALLEFDLNAKESEQENDETASADGPKTPDFQ